MNVSSDSDDSTAPYGTAGDGTAGDGTAGDGAAGDGAAGDGDSETGDGDTETPRRFVAVLVPRELGSRVPVSPNPSDRPSDRPSDQGPVASGPAPPGVDPEELRRAVVEDTYELVAGLELVTPALAVVDRDREMARELTWPGTPVLPLWSANSEETEDTEDEASAVPLRAAMAGVRERGGHQVAIIAADAPDLPPLLIGKLFRALGTGDVAVCPAEGGGLVALTTRLPPPEWLDAALDAVDLDTPDALARLRATAPRSRAVATGPGWHRLRTPADIARLDPGLEGWENTRELLGAAGS